MRVISINLNGCSVCDKSLLSWLAQQEANVIFVQELKLHLNSSAALPEKITSLASNDPFKATLSAKDQQAKLLAEAEHFA